jgi:hypothetical protein
MDAERKKTLLGEKRRLLKQIGSLGEFIRGSVVVLKRPCSYKGCKRCQAGLKHPGWYHTVSKAGKTQTTYLGSALAPRCRGHAEAYKRLLGLAERLSDINLALLTGKDREP